MKKLKIYLDTSVISHLQADDVPDKMAITNELWKQIQTGRYIACISEMVLQELSNCYEGKRQYLLEKVADIDFEFYEIGNEVNELAQKYIQAGAFTDKHLEDALHVACASVNTCNAVVSWNFKHIVKLTAMLLVNGVNRQEGYMELEIVSPEVIVEEG
ncbi:MAG: PIN domain-containing protein [Desulfosporosinus sp.]|nr:PIN domain-containing protein [Desulfosporosinus sp.]MDA8221001.1 PIN domain-containing protein [Desulfitobacterium hafniense]